MKDTSSAIIYEMYECCLGARWVILWSRYGLKQGILWYFFCFLLFILTLCINVHEKHKHFLVWDRIVSAHGAATDLSREFLGIFVFLFVYINLFLPVNGKHKYFLVWDHVVSDHGVAMA